MSSLLETLVTKFFGDPNFKQIKKLDPIVHQINALEPDYDALSESDLKDKTRVFKERIKPSMTDILLSKHLSRA